MDYCRQFRDMCDAYLEEALEEDRRASFRRHIRDCAACRAWALEADPTLLFAVADERSADTVGAETCAAAVTAQIRQQRLGRRLDRRHRPWLMAAAALLLVFAALAWRLMPGGGGLPATLATGTESGEVAPPTVEVEMGGDGVRVYQFASDGDPDTAAYFIVNPALEL